MEKAAEECTKNYPFKGKLTLSELGTLSLDHVMKDQSVFEKIYLHLILSNFLSNKDVKNLNKHSE